MRWACGTTSCYVDVTFLHACTSTQCYVDVTFLRACTSTQCYVDVTSMHRGVATLGPPHIYIYTYGCVFFTCADFSRWLWQLLLLVGWLAIGLASCGWLAAWLAACCVV